MYDVIVVGDGDGRANARLLVAACQALAHRAVEAAPAPMSGASAEYERYEHGGSEQGRQVRRVLPVVPEGRCVDEDARYHKTYSRPAEVHAVARRCCTVAGARRGTCLACLATRQRHRSADDVPGSSDLVQQEATTPTLRNRARLDRAFFCGAVPKMDGVWVPRAGVSQASDR